jgi:hypothetical protein
MGDGDGAIDGEAADGLALTGGEPLGALEVTGDGAADGDMPATRDAVDASGAALGVGLQAERNAATPASAIPRRTVRRGSRWVGSRSTTAAYADVGVMVRQGGDRCAPAE